MKNVINKEFASRAAAVEWVKLENYLTRFAKRRNHLAILNGPKNGAIVMDLKSAHNSGFEYTVLL